MKARARGEKGIFSGYRFGANDAIRWLNPYLGDLMRMTRKCR